MSVSRQYYFLAETSLHSPRGMSDILKVLLSAFFYSGSEYLISC